MDSYQDSPIILLGLISCNPTRTPCNRLVILPPGVYKGGQGSLDRQAKNSQNHNRGPNSQHQITPKRRTQYTTPQTGRRVLRYSGSPNLSEHTQTFLNVCVRLQFLISTSPTNQNTILSTPSVGCRVQTSTYTHQTCLVLSRTCFVKHYCIVSQIYGVEKQCQNHS